MLHLSRLPTKNGFLLIETLKTTKLWPHGTVLSGHFPFVRVCENFAFKPFQKLQTMRERSKKHLSFTSPIAELDWQGLTYVGIWEY